ncbi:MAG TPA: NAD(P)H-dependent oxidoreductase subunit E [Thermodesulfobacteriota bacterium]|nr:NAD(P)H-dependent oxidoreductase subunit E [Thermodesulfobacteriota bacterium]
MTAQKNPGAQAEPSEEQLYQELEGIISRNKEKPGALIIVLHQAQNLFGYLPRKVQQRVADGLGVPLSEVAGVVSFYSFFTMVPKGRHTIKVCLGTACYVRGGRAIAEGIGKEYRLGEGETTQDLRFSYETVRCLGACGLAPVIVVDENVHGRMKAAKVKPVLDKYE